MALKDPRDYLSRLPALRQSPGGSLWPTYDAEGDVRYAHFRQPGPPSDSERADDVIVGYDGAEVIRLTILRASRR